MPTGLGMEVWASAKINLFLKVLDRRPDGYHNIETVLQSVALADRLCFEVGTGPSRLECASAEVPTGSDNLIVRAVELIRKRFPDRARATLHVRLEKRIPVGSGLGGGSADAAATLRACNEIFNLGLTAEQLRSLAVEIGMDVPFLIEGGRAIATGRGELLRPLPVGRKAWAVVAVPDVSISTAWAYGRLDEAEKHAAPDLEEFVNRLQSEPVEVWARFCYNSFEDVVFPAFPEIRRVRDRLLEAGCAGAFLTGSGSAVVGLAGKAELARRAAREVARHCRYAEAVPFIGPDADRTAAGPERHRA